MQTRTPSLTPSAALVLLLASTAAAQDTYDLRALYEVQVGDHHRLRNDAEQRLDVLLQAGGQVMQDEEGTSFVDLDYEEEVLALSEGEVTQARRLYHRIALDSEGDAPRFRGSDDVELEGVEVMWVFKEEEGRCYGLDGSELTPELQEKLEQVDFATNRNQLPVDERTLFPEEPVTVGAEWEISVEAARELIQLPLQDLNEDRFETRTGRLIEVLEIGGQEILHVQIELEAEPDTLAGGLQFDQGAGVVCNLDLWLPANGATSHRLRVLQIVFTGRGKQRNAGGANNPVVSMELDIRSVLIQERSSVGDDAWAISDAVEVTTMFDEDDPDDAGE